MTKKLAESRKAIVGLLAFLGVLATQVFTSGTVNHDLSIVIAGIGTVLTYWVPNDTTGPGTS